MFYGRSYKHLQAAIDSIGENNKDIDIFIIYPDTDYQTDEDGMD